MTGFLAKYGCGCTQGQRTGAAEWRLARYRSHLVSKMASLFDALMQDADDRDSVARRPKIDNVLPNAASAQAAWYGATTFQSDLSKPSLPNPALEMSFRRARPGCEKTPELPPN
jgi:hypothetical protein